MNPSLLSLLSLPSPVYKHLAGIAIPLRVLSIPLLRMRFSVTLLFPLTWKTLAAINYPGRNAGHLLLLGLRVLVTASFQGYFSRCLSRSIFMTHGFLASASDISLRAVAFSEIFSPTPCFISHRRVQELCLGLIALGLDFLFIYFLNHAAPSGQIEDSR